MHCVDLGESFPTSIYLQKSASIQPRTSPSKFGGKYSILFTGVHTTDPLQNTGGWEVAAGLALALLAVFAVGPNSGVHQRLHSSCKSHDHHHRCLSDPNGVPDVSCLGFPNFGRSVEFGMNEQRYLFELWIVNSATQYFDVRLCQSYIFSKSDQICWLPKRAILLPLLRQLRRSI